MPLLTQSEKEFLSQNGYLILHNLLPEHQLRSLKNEIEKLFEEEGVRAGDVRSSKKRQKLIKRAKKGSITAQIRLLWYDKILFWLIKKVVKRIQLIPGYYYLTLLPTLYLPSRKNSRNELKAMFVNALQQAEEKVDRLCNLINKRESFDICITHPKILEALDFLMGEDQYKLSSINYRAPRKGCWTQPIHQDWLWPVKSNECFASNTLWLLDDMTLDNGPTRVIPSSHRWVAMPITEMDDRQASHPDEIYLTAEAGSVIILDGHIWHGGTKNTSGHKRGLIQSYFVHKAHMAQQNQQYLLNPETKNRLSKESLELLGVIE